LFCFVLFCLVLSCLVLSCLVLFIILLNFIFCMMMWLYDYLIICWYDVFMSCSILRVTFVSAFRSLNDDVMWLRKVDEMTALFTKCSNFWNFVNWTVFECDSNFWMCFGEDIEISYFYKSISLYLDISMGMLISSFLCVFRYLFNEDIAISRITQRINELLLYPMFDLLFGWIILHECFISWLKIPLYVPYIAHCSLLIVHCPLSIVHNIYLVDSDSEHGVAQRKKATENDLED
jgi:hypothetical protein